MSCLFGHRWGREIEPYKSEELDDEGESDAMQTR